MSETIGDLKVKLGLDSSQFTSGLQQAGQSAQGFGGFMSSALASMTGFVGASVIMRGVGAATNFAMGSMIGYNSTLQQAQIGFTSMLGSASQAQALLQQLKDFANTSPFELPDVLVGSQRLLAMGFSAQEVIPMLTDVGNVSAAMGRGKQGIDLMTLALGQMNASVQLHTQDLNQMVAAGVPVWDILAKATGKNTAEVRKLVENGQLASDVFIKAFHDWASSNFGDMMAKQAHTFEGAMSTVRDNLHSAIAQGSKPLFDSLTNLANMLGNFVQTDAFQQWIQKVASLAAYAIQWITGLAKSIASVMGLDVSAAIAQMQDVGTAGQQSGKESSTALQGIQASLTGVADTAADTTKALDAQGAAADLQIRSLDKAANGLQAEQKQVQYAIEDTGAAYDRQAKAVEDQQFILQRTIEDTTGAYNAQIDALKEQQSQVEQQAADITRAYEAQITPLQNQIDLLTKATDLEQKRSDDALKLQDIELQQAELAAEGDPKKRAALAAQLALLKSKQDEHDLDQRIADAERQIAQDKKGTDVEGLQLQLQQLQLQKQQAALADPKKLAEIAGQQELLKAQQQQTSLTEQEKATKQDILAIPLEEKAAQLKAAEQGALDPLNKQVQALKDQQDALTKQRDEQLKPMQDQLKALQRQDEDIKRAKEAALAPMQAQLSNLGRQNDALSEQRSYGQGIKSDIDAAKQAAKDQQTGQSNSVDLAPGTPRLPQQQITPVAQFMGGLEPAAVGHDIARKMTAGIKGWLRDHLPEELGTGIGMVVGGLAFGPIGAVAGALLGHAIADGLKAHNGDLGAALADWGRQFETWIAPRIGPMLREAGKLYLELNKWFYTVALPAIIKALGEWGLEFIKWVGPQIPPLLVELAKLTDQLNTWLITVALPELIRKLAMWGQAFLDWVGTTVLPNIGPTLGNILTSIGTWMANDALPWLGREMPKLGKAAIDGLWDGIKSIVTFEANLQGWVGTHVIDAIKGALGLEGKGANALLDIGKSIVSGLWDGIKSMGDWFKDLWNKWIKDHLPGPIADALQIKSPSRVMAEIAKQIPAGILVGINEGSASIAARMRTLVPAPSMPMGGLPLNAQPATAAAAGRMGGGEIHNHVYLGNERIETIVNDAVTGQVRRTY